MQLAVVAADFTGGEADQLRRAMPPGGARASSSATARLLDGLANQRLRPRVRQRMSSRSRASAIRLPRIHAASFALLVYASAWVKMLRARGLPRRAAQQPADGLLCALAADPGRPPAWVEVRAADVTVSEWDCTLEPPPNIRRDPAPRPRALHQRSQRPVPPGQHTPSWRQRRTGGEHVACVPARGAPRPAHDPRPRPRRRHRIVAARGERASPTPRTSPRARLDAGELRTSPPAVLANLAGHRCQACGRRAAPRPARPARRGPGGDVAATLDAPAEDRGPARRLRPPRLHPRSPPLSFVRDQLPAAALSHRRRHHRRARPHARPRRRPGHLPPAPGTAKGTLFLTWKTRPGSPT